MGKPPCFHERRSATLRALRCLPSRRAWRKRWRKRGHGAEVCGGHAMRLSVGVACYFVILVSYYPSSGAGSATGITQTGGGWVGSFTYGLSSSFVIQLDSVQAIDRVNDFTGSTGGIFGGMSIFFREDSPPAFPQREHGTTTPSNLRPPHWNSSWMKSPAAPWTSRP